MVAHTKQVFTACKAEGTSVRAVAATLRDMQANVPSHKRRRGDHTDAVAWSFPR